MVQTEEDIASAAKRALLAQLKKDASATKKASATTGIAVALAAAGASVGAPRAAFNFSSGERIEAGNNALIAGIERYSDASLRNNNDGIKILQPSIAGSN